jgi:Nif-specific regulatory protein
MRIDTLDFISGAGTTLAEADGLRSGSAVVLEQLRRGLGATIGFTVLRRRDGEGIDLISSAGLGAADFRRLEERLLKSSLRSVFERSGPIAVDNLAGDPVLSFVAFATGTRALLAVPMVLRGSTIGMIAVGFPPDGRFSEAAVIKLLKTLSVLFAQSSRVERLIADEGRRLLEENVNLRKELRQKYDFGEIIGNSGPMRQVYDRVQQIARSNATVLLRGERGTGKGLIANAIHYNSLRSKGPFVKVNCAAIPDDILESELFGLKSSAQAGIGSRTKSKIELAEGGTLFLDEIGELPSRTQAELMHVLQDREFAASDGSTAVRVNVRLIAATNKNLEEEVRTGRFREDLFFRLNVFTIYLPPLRDRKSDILLLAEHFLKKYEEDFKKAVKRISTPAIDMLTAYHFPGNVRELENAIATAVAAADSSVIHGHHLPPTLQTAENTGTETRVTLASAVGAFERDLIQDTLKSTRGNIARAASMLDSTERILGYKIKKYSIDPKRFRL